MRLVPPLVADIEDQENWHGKPIPKDKLKSILDDLESQIQVPNKTLCPQLPNDDAKPADLSPISFSSPPAQKKGEKVQVSFLWQQETIFIFF